MTALDRLASIPFRRLVWCLPASFALHEAEEWNIMSWYQAQFINPPTTNPVAVYTWLVGISLVGFLWTGAACLLPTASATARFALPFFVVLVFGNALQHLYWQVAFGVYAPGFLASAVLNIPLTLLVSWHALRNRLVGHFYVLVLYLLCVPAVTSVVAAGRTVSPVVQRIHVFSTWLAHALFGAA